MKQSLSLKLVNFLIFLTALSAGTLLLSNLMAVKLWNFNGIAVDGGLIIFPLSYILGDLAVELYGKKIANRIVVASVVLNLLAVFIFAAAVTLPPHQDWPYQSAFASIFTFAPRITLASLLAFLSSQFFNNTIFAKIKLKTGERKFYLRALISSTLSRALDLLIFESVAFWGILPISEFIRQIIFAYLAGMILELLLTPLSYFVLHFIRKRELL